MDCQQFSMDILSEIFSRTSLQVVGKVRTLSRACNSVTYDSNFLKHFTERTNTVSGFFVQCFVLGRYTSSFFSPNDPSAVITFDFLPGDEKQIVAVAKQGLLLCENMAPRHQIAEFYVCKPTTRQWRHLPNPKTRFLTQATGMLVLGSDPLRYKIVRLSEPKDRAKTYKFRPYSTRHCEVFDSASWKWTKLEDDIKLAYGQGFVGRNVPAVSAGAVLYWLMSNRRVFAFHVRVEASITSAGRGEYWEILDLPFPLCSKGYYHSARLVEYCGRLGIICRGEDFFDLWTMEDGAGKVWSRRKSVRTTHPPSGFYGSEIALTQGYCEMRCHNLVNGNATKFSLGSANVRDARVFQFQSDFELI